MTIDAAEFYARQREARYAAMREARADTVAALNRMLTPAGLRDPRAASAQVGYSSPGRSMPPEWNGGEAIKYAYLSNVVVYACVTAYANAISGASFRLGADPEKPGEYNTNHPLARMLGRSRGRAARGWSSKKWWRFMVANRIVQGHCAAELERDRSGRVVALWPLVVTPDMFQRIPTQGGGSYWAAFKYGRPNAVRTLRVEDVLYSIRPKLNDPREPESLIEAAKLDVSVAVMDDRYSYAFARNDARPAAIVVHQMFEELGERDAFRRQFLSKHQGPDNAGQIAFAEVDGDGDTPVGQTLDVKTLGLSQKDSQFAQTYERKLTNIAIGLGVPFSLLDASGRTYDNANVEERHFYLNRAIPFGEELVDDINADVAPEFGTDVGWLSFDHIEALRPASRWASENPIDLVKSRILARSELRTDQGVDGQPEQDGHAGVGLTLVEQTEAAKNLILAGADPKDVWAVVGLPDMALTPAPVPGPTPGAVPDDPAAPVLPLPTSASASLLAELRAEADAIEERRARIWRTVDAQVRGLEATWERAFSTLFAKQQRATLERLTGKPGRQMLRTAIRDDKAEPTPDDIFTPGYWRDETAAAAEPLLRSVVSAGSSRLVDDLGISFDISQPYVDAFIQGRANQLAGDVTDTTYAAIKDALSAGVDAGESIDKLAARIAGVFDEATGGRARRIARTEVNSAYHSAQQEVADQLGTDVVAGKEWIAVRDSRTREAHGAADGQVVEITANFRVGGEEMRTPGTSGDPSNDVNCFPAGTMISTPPLAGGYRRWYDGDLVEITTAGGHQLAGTPNHPILTPAGWLPMHALMQGDHVVSGNVRDLGGRALSPYVYDVPTAIEEVFRALSSVAVQKRVGGCDVDFHGDGRRGEVDVVRTGSQLRDRLDAALREHCSEDVLSGADLAERDRALLGLASQLLGTSALTATSGIGGGSQALTVDGSGLGHAREHGAAAVATLDAALQQSSSDSGSADAKELRESILGFAGQVAADEIVSVERKAFHGFVYNVETTTQWYIANGIVVHNCRCTVAWLTPSEMEKHRSGNIIELRDAETRLRAIAEAAA